MLPQKVFTRLLYVLVCLSVGFTARAQDEAVERKFYRDGQVVRTSVKVEDPVPTVEVVTPPVEAVVEPEVSAEEAELEAIREQLLLEQEEFTAPDSEAEVPEVEADPLLEEVEEADASARPAAPAAGSSNWGMILYGVGALVLALVTVGFFMLKKKKLTTLKGDTPPAAAATETSPQQSSERLNKALEAMDG